MSSFDPPTRRSLAEFMRFPLQRLTAYCLLAMYGLVGLMGESLQYLTDDFSHWLSKPSVPMARSGYYHTHNGHRHFHRYSARQLKEISQSSNSSVHTEGNLRSHHLSHLDHDCPLLTVISTLELSAFSRVAFFINSPAVYPAATEPNSCRCNQPILALRARGPPNFLPA